MYLVIAFMLWLAGFALSLYNYVNVAVAAVAIHYARFGWYPGRKMPPLFRTVSWCLWVSSAFFVEKVFFFGWLAGLGITVGMIFVSSFIAAFWAWGIVEARYPDEVALHRNLRNM